VARLPTVEARAAGTIAALLLRLRAVTRVVARLLAVAACVVAALPPTIPTLLSCVHVRGQASFFFSKKFSNQQKKNFRKKI
jgi:hypothetical protein